MDSQALERNTRSVCFILIGWIQNRVRLKARGRGLHTTPVATSSFLVHSFPFRATATMPPRRRRPSYHGVHERSDDTFMAVITCANNERVCLGRFWHAYLAARAYDVASWGVGRPPAGVNKRHRRNLEEGEGMAEPPPLPP